MTCNFDKAIIKAHATHKETQKVECQYCGALLQKRSLSQHQQTLACRLDLDTAVYEVEGTTCACCKRSFKNPSRLRLHLKTSFTCRLEYTVEEDTRQTQQNLLDDICRDTSQAALVDPELRYQELCNILP
jgi:hypothetical protein